MGLDQGQARLLERHAVLDRRSPRLGVGRLGVPPDRVVVEVRDHEHPPAGLDDDELRTAAGPSPTVLDDGGRVSNVTLDDRAVHDHADLQPDVIAAPEWPHDQWLG